MGTGGVHFSRRQTCDQKAAVIVHASDITPLLRRRARTSMIISLETGHLVWDSNNLFFTFYFFSWLVQFYFFHETISKKVDPNFADRFDQSGRPKKQTKQETWSTYGTAIALRSQKGAQCIWFIYEGCEEIPFHFYVLTRNAVYLWIGLSGSS